VELARGGDGEAEVLGHQVGGEAGGVVHLEIKSVRTFGYPPDKQEKAARTVLKQAELLCRDWAG